MKIYYTTDFKDCLKDSSKIIDLRYYGLRHGEFDGELNDINIKKSEFKSSPSNGFYQASGLLYGDQGIQLSIEIPETDNSFYYIESDTEEKESYYQAIIFYFVEINSRTREIKPAFIIFGDYQYDLETATGVFSGLNLTSLRNIITIKELPSRKCKIIFYTDGLVERLENETLYLETNREGKTNSIYGSRQYIETKLDLVSREDSNDRAGYFRTLRINNFGLKLY